MSVFAPLWRACAAAVPLRFSTQLFNRFDFHFHFSDPWDVAPIERALRLNIASPLSAEGWNIYATSTAICDIAPYLANFPRDMHGQLALPDEPHVVAFYDSLHGVFRVYDHALKRAAIICAEDYIFSEWELHSPFREFWHLWALANGGLLVHSGMVCDDNKALLLPARGGSGKSTTVLSCLQAGMTTTGDDYNLLLRQGGHWVAAPLFANIKMKTPLTFDFPLLSAWPQQTLTYANKTIYYPPPNTSIWNIKQPRVVGVLCPEIGAKTSAIEPIRQAVLLQQLTVSSIIQSPYGAAAYMAQASALAKQVKSAKLRLSENIGQNVNLLQQWLAAA